MKTSNIAVVVVRSFKSFNSSSEYCNYNLFTFEKQSGCSLYTIEILMLLLVYLYLAYLISRPFSFIYKFHFMFRHQNCIRINNGRNRTANSSNRIAIIVSNNNKIDMYIVQYKKQTNQVNRWTMYFI